MEHQIFFRNLWNSYSTITPCAQKIKSIFENEGETVVNDHIAFRTIDAGEISITSLQPLLFDFGYKVFDTYLFKEKKLIANAYKHEDPSFPKIFLSGLQVNYFSDEVQKILMKIVDASYHPFEMKMDIFYNGPMWGKIYTHEYQTLLNESEYAAWFAVFGIRPNHFTVSVNNLKKFKDLNSVLNLVESNGFKINDRGGRIKGNPSILLEQGSTMAETVTVDMYDSLNSKSPYELIPVKVPSCYYEFALRYPDKNGKLYEGFVETSADKIFESTDSK